jgi:Flp pilus assembly protein TadG
MKKKAKSRLGATLIEFILVTPPLLLLFVAMMEYSIILYNTSVINDASRRGARYGTMLTSLAYPTTSSVVSYTTNLTSGKLISFSKSTTAVTVTATPSATPAQFGDTLTVTVQWTYTDLIIHTLLNISQSHIISAKTTAPYN